MEIVLQTTQWILQILLHLYLLLLVFPEGEDGNFKPTLERYRLQPFKKSEHRFTLQHTAQYGKALGFNASHRIRLEARKFENDDFGSERFRYLLRMQHNTQRSLIPVFWNEAFVNFNEEALTGDTIFERNRLFLGFRHKTKADLDLEFGYLNQYVPRDSGDTSEHLLVLYVFM